MTRVLVHVHQHVAQHICGARWGTEVAAVIALRPGSDPLRCNSAWMRRAIRTSSPVMPRAAHALVGSSTSLVGHREVHDLKSASPLCFLVEVARCASNEPSRSARAPPRETTAPAEPATSRAGIPFRCDGRARCAMNPRFSSVFRGPRPRELPLRGPSPPSSSPASCLPCMNSGSLIRGESWGGAIVLACCGPPPRGSRRHRADELALRAHDASRLMVLRRARRSQEPSPSARSRPRCPTVVGRTPLRRPERGVEESGEAERRSCFVFGARGVSERAREAVGEIQLLAGFVPRRVPRVEVADGGAAIGGRGVDVVRALARGLARFEAPVLAS